MDVIAWLVLAGILLVAVVALVIATLPGVKARRFDRWENGTATSTGGFGGVATGFDAVWRPSAEDASRHWQAQTELPAPAPAPGDKGLDDGPVVITVREHPVAEDDVSRA